MKTLVQVNELRIGNWVIDNDDNQIAKVTQLEIDENHPEITDVDCQPISITVKWLINFGFKIVRKKSILGEVIDIYQQYLSSRISIFTIGYDKWILDINDKDIVEIQYIHQLQNLYFVLTKEELEIK